MSGTYASRTKVDVNTSQSEIERTLDRYGATAYMYSKMNDKILVMFEMKKRRIRFVLTLPPRKDFEKTDTGKARTSQNAIDDAHQQAIRARWRSLALVIKAKLDSVATGIEEFEEAFMGQIVLPNNQSVKEWMQPQIAEVYANGQMPKLMLLGSGE